MNYTTAYISNILGVSTGTVQYRAKEIGIEAIYKNGRYWYTPFQMEAISNYQTKHKQRKLLDYDKVIKEFKRSKINTAIVLSEKMHLPFHRVNKIMDRYFSEAMTEMTNRYEILESKMNFENFE